MATPVLDAAQAAIPRYAAVLHSQEFRAELERRCTGEWHWGTPHDVRVQPLKWHRERCTFELSLRTDEGWRALIGKVFEADQPRAFATMQAIRDAGFAGETGFAIPRPLAYLPSLRVLLEEKVDGPSAKQILLTRGHDEQRAAARRCGQWLARFHATAPARGQVAEPVAELDRYRQWADSVAQFGEPLAAASRLLYARLAEAAPRGVEPRAGHGSYIPEHVLLSGPRTVVIDLDESVLADPGQDIAWFMVSVQRLALVHLGSLHALDGAAEEFLGAYVASGGAAAVRHVPYYRALECLHRARRDLVKRAPPVPHWAARMLEEGLTAL